MLDHYLKTEKVEHVEHVYTYASMIATVHILQEADECLSTSSSIE